MRVRSASASARCRFARARGSRSRRGPITRRLTCTGAVPLSYLCLSTVAEADVVVYPDSEKIAVFCAPDGDFFGQAWARGIFPRAGTVGYYDGEVDDGDEEANG